MELDQPRKSVLMKRLPMSPSINTLYETVREDGRSFRIETQAYSDYTSQMKQHYLIHAASYISALHLVQQWKNQGYKRFQLNATFYFEESRVLCKNGDPKKLDLSNRIKSLEDVAFKLLNLEHKFIWRLFSGKEVVRDGEGESVTIELFPCDH